MKRIQCLRLTTITIASLLAPLHAIGQNDGSRSGQARSDRPQQGQTQQSMSSGSTQRQTSRPTMVIRGTIDSFRHIGVRSDAGSRDQHSLVRLRLEDGRRVVADLGPKRNLDRFSLSRGDRIQLRGERAIIDGRSVFLTRQIRLDGQTIQIQRQGEWAQRGSQRQESRGQSATEQRRTSMDTYELSGRVDGFRTVKLRNHRGTSSEHSLIRVRLENGQEAVVDLGTRKSLEDLELQKGDRIRIQGHRGTIDGRTVLMANQIRVGEETFNIQRSRQTSPDHTFALRGQVEGYQLVTVGSGEDKQALLKLRLLNGQTVLIDAGKQYEAGDLDLKNLDLMDQVTIKGHRKTANGETVWVVDSIQFDDPRGQADLSQRGSEQEPRQSPEQQVDEKDPATSG